jgi:ribonucleoside-diphosphate reductase alpha chain
MTAWKSGLKGVTVYRDGSRTGVLVNEKAVTTKTNEFGYNNAPKRPKELEAHYYFGKNGHEYAIIVGLLHGKPYEVFAFANPLVTCELKGRLIKNGQGHYSFQSKSYTIDHLELSSEHKDEILLTRWVSLLLRHGANPKFIAQQVEKSQMNIVSFSKIIARILKLYIPNENTKEKCEHCGEATMVREEGCIKCTNCGYSKC